MIEVLKKLIYILSSVVVISCTGSKKTISDNSESKIIDKYATILQTPKSNLTNTALYAFVDNWYGIKYKYGGMSESGVDCSGFCNVLYNQVYKKQIRRTTSELSKDINKAKKSNLKEGDLVFFNISKKKNSHVGVYLTNNRFVHASTSKGVIISSLDNPYYKKTYAKGGSL